MVKEKERLCFYTLKRAKENKWIDRVVITSHGPNSGDMSVNKELEKIRPNIFANGGDRTRNNIPEVAICKIK